MQFLSLGAVRCMSLLWRRKAPEINNFFVVRNFGFPRLSREPLFVTYAFVSVFIVSLAICAIFAMKGEAKVGNPIIVFVSIYMVYLFCGPFFMGEKPSQPMSGIGYAIKLDVPVSFVFFNVPSHASYLDFRARRSPYENPSFGVIVKRLENFFMFCHNPTLPERETDCKKD